MGDLTETTQRRQARDTRPMEGRPRLIVLAGHDAGRIYTLAPVTTIGRSRDSTVVIDSADASRRHARIVAGDDAEYILEDLGSRNGTHLNGERITKRQLRFGDKLRFAGETVLLFTHHHSLEEQLLQSQRLESIGQLAGGIAHDFNNLITAVLTSLDFLKQMDPTSQLGEERIHDSLLDAESAARRAMDLTRQLLGFAQRGKYDERPTDMSTVIEEVVRLLRRTFDRSIEIDTQVDAGLTVVGDRSQLSQVVMNLCINARDAMEGGGTLHVLGKLEVAPVEGWPGTPQRGRVVMLTVSDSGVGMDEEARRRAFEPFFTTKPKGIGTGLGLATVYGIVKNHAGHIKVESQTGIGTTFRVYLPLADSPAASRGGMETSAGLPAIGSETVLLVDDDPLVRRGCGRLLEKLGYTIHYAADGREAINTYQKSGKDIDVVILDMRMPVMGGEETFYALRQMDPEARVILTSGHSEDETTNALLRRGALGFLGKPYTTETLVESISRAMKAKAKPK